MAEQERPIWLHQIGTHDAGHVMTLEELRNLLYVVEGHATGMPPTITFPAGFWIRYSSHRDQAVGL